MTAIQVVLILFGLFASSRAVVSFRRGTLRVAPLALWLLFWAMVVVVAIDPDTTAVLARWFGVTRGADLAIYLAIVLLFFLMFRLFARIESLERFLTRLVREEALERFEGQRAEGTGQREDKNQKGKG